MHYVRVAIIYHGANAMAKTIMYLKPVEEKKTPSTMWLGLKRAALKSNVLICIHYAWWFSLLGVYDKWRVHRNNPLSICAWAINTYYCVFS